jgi:hypothetical protein
LPACPIEEAAAHLPKALDKAGVTNLYFDKRGLRAGTSDLDKAIVSLEAACFNSPGRAKLVKGGVTQ